MISRLPQFRSGYFIAISAVAIWILSIASALGHRFHTVYVEMERIPESQELQIAVRVSPEDLVAAFRLEFPDKELDPETLSPPQEWITRYMNRSFEWHAPSENENAKEKVTSSHSPKLTWLGMERLETESWIYLEGSLTKALPSLEIRSRFFFEFDGALSNILVLREGDWRRTLHCSPLLNTINLKSEVEKPSRPQPKSQDNVPNPTHPKPESSGIEKAANTNSIQPEF